MKETEKTAEEILKARIENLNWKLSNTKRLKDRANRMADKYSMQIIKIKSLLIKLNNGL